MVDKIWLKDSYGWSSQAKADGDEPIDYVVYFNKEYNIKDIEKIIEKCKQEFYDGEIDYSLVEYIQEELQENFDVKSIKSTNYIGKAYYENLYSFEW